MGPAQHSRSSRKSRGKVRYEDVVEGETLRLEKDPSGHMRRLIMEHKGELHPQIVLEDSEGKPLDVYYLPERAHIVVEEGKVVSAGTVLAKTPREAARASPTSPAVCRG